MLEDWEHLPIEVPHDFIIRETLPTMAMDCALDVENDPDGWIGNWSLAYRDLDGKLAVKAYNGTDRTMRVGLGGRTVMHNAKYDLRVLARNGMPQPKDPHDTMIAAFCMGLGKQEPADSGKTEGSKMTGGLGLKYLARRQLGMPMMTWQEVYGHPELVPMYNASDSVATFLLWEKWKDQLPQHYWTIDMPLLRTLMAIEDRGIQVEPNFLKEYAEGLDRELASMSLPLNVHANQEIQSYIYGTLGIAPWKFTADGQPSVESSVLETIDDPLVKDIIHYKEIYKEKNTDAKGYMKAIDENGRIHTELKQTSTATGRLSSANPNLQNVAKSGSTIRRLFTVPEGKKMIRLDYELIEFGALAVLAKDEELINAFVHGDKKKGTDVHSQTGAALGIDRDTAKHINFLMQNGGTAWGMSSTYNLPIGLTTEYFKKYFLRFPALKRFQDETVAKAYETKHVEGYFGRRRRVDALFSTDWKIRKDGEKEAKTFPMQNLAAEIVKLGMIDLHYKHDAPMLLQVHDELLFEVDEKDAEDYAHWLKEYVPHITEIEGVAFPVEVKIGTNWEELSK